MTNDLQDRLLDWISEQEKIVKTLIGNRIGNTKSYYEGKYVTLIDVKVFIMSDGKIKEPIEEITKEKIKEF